MRLICAEDDPVLGNAMQKALVRSEFAVDWVHTGREFRQAISLTSYEFALLDLSLPDEPGEALLRRLRDKPPRVPVIIVSGHKEVQERVNLLEMGADDYLVKPFDLTELVARVRCVARRSAANDAEPNPGALSHGPLRLFPQRNAASWYGIPVELSRHEYRVLRHPRPPEEPGSDPFSTGRVGLRLGPRGRKQRDRGVHPLPAPQVQSGPDRNGSRRRLQARTRGAECLAIR